MKDIEETAKDIVHCAVNVHKALGPGLLESVYQQCFAYDLEKAGHVVACEAPVPVTYKEVKIDLGFRVDMKVDKAVIIENKTVEKILPIHEAQLLTYLKLTNHRLGFLLNWNVTLMKDGIKRMINDLWR
jgi:GxxExxY protein